MHAKYISNHLPVAEDQLWTGQPAGPLADLVSKSEALSHRHYCLYNEDVRPFLHLFMEDATLSLAQYTIYSTWHRKRHSKHGV